MVFARSPAWLERYFGRRKSCGRPTSWQEGAFAGWALAGAGFGSWRLRGGALAAASLRRLLRGSLDIGALANCRLGRPSLAAALYCRRWTWQRRAWRRRDLGQEEPWRRRRLGRRSCLWPRQLGRRMLWPSLRAGAALAAAAFVAGAFAALATGALACGLVPVFLVVAFTIVVPLTDRDGSVLPHADKEG